MSRFMRIIVMFDLPVVTASQRRAASQFRNFLIQDGYSMMQFSIYVRICNGVDSVAKHRARVEGAVPVNGSVRILVVTDKQFASMDILVGGYAPSDVSTSEAQIGFF